MISKNDVVLLLSDLDLPEREITQMVRRVYSSVNIPLDILKLINDARPLELTQFYSKLRQSYNQKKSKLYISIVRDSLKAEDILTTLAAYNLQVSLYANKLADNQMFLKHARAREVNLVLAKYYTDYDLTSCLNLLKLIKADLVACETITGRRE